MNEIHYSQSSSTFSHVLTAGLVAAHLMHSGPVQPAEEGINPSLFHGTYFAGDNRDTFTNCSNPITGSYGFVSTGFEQAVSRFYARLLEDQEPLGPDFERILYDNLWDLYES